MDQHSSLASRGIDLTFEPRFDLGGVEFDPQSHEASINGLRQRLQPQMIKVLIALARRRGEVVARDELVDLCWAGRIVGDDVINRSILYLRGVASRLGGFAIETVPKAGYRLVEVERKHSARRRTGVLIAAVTAIAIAIAAIMLARASAPSTQGTPPTPTVAVLPFTADGDVSVRELASAVDNSLAHMLTDSNLPVRRASSVENARESADFLINGNVHAEAGVIIVTLQMQNLKQNAVLFSKVFKAPTGNTGGLPDQIGAYAAANLTWSGAMMTLDSHHAVDQQVTADLLRQFMITIEQGDAFRAYEISASMAPKAPDSAVAQLSLALNTGFVLDQLPREDRAAAVATALKAARRAHDLAPDFADVYLPACSLHPPLPLEPCELALRTGLGFNSDGSFASAWLRRFLGDVGRNGEAVNYARMSLANDPYKPGKLGGLIGRLELLGRQTEAEENFHNGVRWWPTLPIFYWERANGMAQRGDLEAVARFAKESPPDLFPITRVMALGLADGVRDHRPDRVREVCRVQPQRPGDSFFTSVGTAPGALFFCLAAMSQLGDMSSAFALATSAYPDYRARTVADRQRRWLDHPATVPTSILASPALVAMRRDPRFMALADRVGLLEYWRSVRLPDFCTAKAEPICPQLRSRP